jgi:hypothetical protein
MIGYQHTGQRATHPRGSVHPKLIGRLLRWRSHLIRPFFGPPLRYTVLVLLVCPAFVALPLIVTEPVGFTLE